MSPSRVSRIDHWNPQALPCLRAGGAGCLRSGSEIMVTVHSRLRPHERTAFANSRLIVFRIYSRSSAIRKCEPLRTWLLKPPRVSSAQPAESAADTHGSQSPTKLLIGKENGSTG